MNERLGHIRDRVLTIMAGGVVEQESTIWESLNLQEVQGGKTYRRRCGRVGRGVRATQ